MKAKSNLARKAIPTMSAAFRTERRVGDQQAGRGCNTGPGRTPFSDLCAGHGHATRTFDDASPGRTSGQAMPFIILYVYFAWLTLRSMIHVLGLDLAPATRAMGLGRPLLPTFTQMRGVVVCSICLNRTPL